MNMRNTHPDTELLDMLRAGLLDGDPRREELAAHVRTCSDCQMRADWQRLLQENPSELPDLEQRLNRAREHALRAPRRSLASHRLLPLAAAASIALLAVLLVQPWQQSLTPDPQIAAAAKDGPEFYEELDFYLWLADHNGVDKDSAT